MIITVTLNTAIDKTLSVPSFRPGARNRAVDQNTAVGGKGINVARVLRTLGHPVIATGLAGGATGTRIIDTLSAELIPHDFVRIASESRTSTAVIDPTTNEHTEINEYGPVVTDGELELFREKLMYLARGARICVIAGSVPRKVPPPFYAELIGDLRKLGVASVVDAEGDVMRLAVKAGPDVISPNLAEAEELVGHEFHDEGDTAGALIELRERGARTCIITDESGCWAMVGADGDGELLRVAVEAQEAVSTVGSGDAFLAGYVGGMYLGWDDERRLRYAVACGAESTRHFGSGVVDRQIVDRTLAKVTVSTLPRVVAR